MVTDIESRNASRLRQDVIAKMNAETRREGLKVQQTKAETDLFLGLASIEAKAGSAPSDSVKAAMVEMLIDEEVGGGDVGPAEARRVATEIVNGYSGRPGPFWSHYSRLAQKASGNYGSGQADF